MATPHAKTLLLYVSSCFVDGLAKKGGSSEPPRTPPRYGPVSEVCEDGAIDGRIEKEEIANCIRKLKNNKTGGSDGLEGELLKYGGSSMVYLLELE